MINTNNTTITNQTAIAIPNKISIQKIQELFGNYEIIDYFAIYGLSPIGLLGLILNIISLITFKKKQLSNKPCFDYIRHYLYTGILLSLLFFLRMFYLSPSYFKFADTFEAKFFNIRITFPIFSVIYFYNCFLDLIISMERAIQFLPKLNFINKFSHFKVSMCLFSVSLLLNASYFCVYSPAQYDFPLGANATYRVYYIDLSSYGRSQLGQINILAIYVLRDIITLFIGLGFNLTTIVLLRRFVKNKRNLNTHKEQSSKDVKHVNLNVSYMVITMSLLASMEHFFFLLTYLYYYLSKSNNYVSVVLNLVSMTFILFKQVANFFIFFSFNKIFRCEFLNLILMKNTVITANSTSRNNNT